MKKYNILGVILARGGSKGIKKKNIKPICGHPLISYSIYAGIKSKYIDRLIVSTDSLEIKNVSKRNFELPARVSLEEFEKEIGVKLKIEKKDEIDTIGGFIFLLIGRIPGRGEVINYNKVLEFTIIEADTRRIKKILVSLKK